MEPRAREESRPNLMLRSDGAACATSRGLTLIGLHEVRRDLILPQGHEHVLGARRSTRRRPSWAGLPSPSESQLRASTGCRPWTDRSTTARRAPSRARTGGYRQPARLAVPGSLGTG